MTHNKLTCLFGFHDYSKRLTRDKSGRKIHLCKICKRSGYRKFRSGFEVRRDYDEKGNLVHSKWDNGEEYWTYYDEEGNKVGWDESSTRQTQ